MPVDVGLLFGAYNLVSGAVKEGKAKNEAANLQRTRPKRTTSSFANDDLALSKSELQQGMSADAERAYDTLENKQLSTSLDAILKSGGSVNSVGEVFGKSNEGRANLAIIKDQSRLARVNNLVRSYQMENEETQANFAANEFAPWKDNAEANAEARKAAAQQETAGINTIGGSLIQGIQSKEDRDMYDRYFEKGSGGKDNMGETATFSSADPNAPRYNPNDTITTLTQQPTYNLNSDRTLSDTPPPVSMRKDTWPQYDMSQYNWR